MFGPNIEFIECQSFYNILNEGNEYAKIGNPYYLYLIDCRSRKEYNESHIICAKNIKKVSTFDYFDMKNTQCLHIMIQYYYKYDSVFQLPFAGELQSRNLVVVYDGNTSNLKDKSNAVECAKLLSDNGCKCSVKILKGGFESFSRLYPFLRTQQILNMPRELDEIKTYPSEIISKYLYLGNKRHGTEQYIKKDLKISSYIECTTSGYRFKDENSIDYLTIPIQDDPNASIEEYLEQACNFIDVNVKIRKQPCLIYSDLGISRSAAICIAYLVYSEKLNVLDALNKVAKHKKIQPQIAFIEQIERKFSKQNG